MKKTIAIILLGFLTIISPGCIAIRRMHGGGSGLDAIKANGNAPSAIQSEIVSDEFVSLLAFRLGMQEWRVRRHFPIVQVSDYGSISYSTRSPSNLVSLTERYINMRRAGHSKAYAMARLQAEPTRSTIPEDCLEILHEDKDAYLPALWLFSFEVKPGTNYTTYVILDGDLAWSYVISRKNDRTLIGCYSDFFDAKGILPEYQKVFCEVHAQVEKEMKDSGDWDQFGSCNGYWSRKQELLKKKGINWQSPPDLHPGACYD